MRQDVVHIVRKLRCNKFWYTKRIMIDSELKEHLEKIEDELVKMRRRTTGVHHALLRGIVYGAGYVIGAVLIIIIVGWILNVIGVIPAFSHQVQIFQTALENVGRTVK